MNAGTLIYNAVEELGVLDPGESLNTSELTDALERVNRLIDNWSSQRLMILASLVTSKSLTGAQGSYTIGTGQQINLARPLAIMGASHVVTTAGGKFVTMPVKIVSIAEWNSISNRDTQDNFIRALFYDRGYPVGNINVAPIPFEGNLQITTWQALAQFPDQSTDVPLLPGYERCLVLGAASEIAPMFQVTPSQQLMQNLADALANVRQLNAELMGPEPPAGIVTAAANTGPVASSNGAPGG